MTRCLAVVVTAVASLLAARIAAAEPQAGKFYRIINVHSNKCLALADGGAKSDESQIVQRAPGQGERQQWSFEPLAGGKHYRIVNRGNGQALSVNSTEADAPVFASTSAKGRQWGLEQKGDNYLIRSRHSDLVIDVVDNSTERKAPIAQSKSNDRPNQLFRIEEISN